MLPMYHLSVFVGVTFLVATLGILLINTHSITNQIQPNWIWWKIFSLLGSYDTEQIISWCKNSNQV